MSNNWSFLDSKVDAKALNEEVKDLGSGDFPELPLGKYEVALDSLVMKPTKEKGFPMVAACFTIVNGEYKKFKIFVNQVVYMGDDNDKYRLRGANEFLKGFKTNVPVTFESFTQYGNMVDEIAKEAVGYEFLIEYSKNKKGYDTYKILEAY